MKKNKDRLFLILIIIILLILLFFYVKDTLKRENKVASDASITETIESFGYKSKSNKSELFKSKFNELKVLLSTNDYDEEEYVELISELFIIDFYTLDKKISNTDIGGIDFVYSSIKDNFSLKATETIYKYVENNLYGNNEFELPIVSEVTITNLKNVTYSYENNTDKKAYEISIEWKYEKDLGYDTNKTLYFVHENNKLSLVEMK